MKTNPEKLRAWKERSAKKAQDNRAKKYKLGHKHNQNYANRNKPSKAIKAVSDRRRTENSAYGESRKVFLEEHPICPVTGYRTTDIHHTAHREGGWLNLQRYWVAVSREGHDYIGANPAWAKENNLIVSVNALYDHHCRCLIDDGISLTKPLFYTLWHGKNLK